VFDGLFRDSLVDRCPEYRRTLMNCPRCGGNNFKWAKTCDHCQHRLGEADLNATTVLAVPPRPAAGTATPSQDLLLSVGDEIKPGFEIEQILQGGMGIVYICKASASSEEWDPKGQRLVPPSAAVAEGRDSRRWVFKTFRAEVLTQTDGYRRFQRECLIWSTLLPHPNVVRAYTVDHMGHRFFLFLEYVDGGDLRQRMRGGALALEDALRIGLQFCVGMQFLSESYGIIHRDIKPENVLLTTDGTAKVTDFGLVGPSHSHHEMNAAAHSDVRDDRVMTMDGAIVGTVPYMSPEQLTGLPLGETSDVYAFGVMFYEMLAGHRPFGGGNVSDLRRQHLNDTPIPLHECGSVPVVISDIVAKCLAKLPASRFDSFAELSAHLERYCRATGLADLIPNKPSNAALEASMGYHDWSGRAYSLAKLGDSRRANREEQRIYFERSHEYYARALALEPTAPGANSNVGTSLERLGRMAEALPYHEREVALHPEWEFSHASLARAYFALGHREKGFEEYERATALAPNEISIWRQLAGFYALVGKEADRARAIEHVQTILAQQSETRAAATAIVTAVACGDWGDVRSAIDLHHYSVKRWPGIALAWFNFGVTLHRGAAFEQARGCYDRALQLNPHLTWALLYRGLVCAASGEINLACQDWQSAVSHHHRIVSDTAAKFIDMAKERAAGAVAIARDMKTLKPMLQYQAM